MSHISYTDIIKQHSNKNNLLNLNILTSLNISTTHLPCYAEMNFNQLSLNQKERGAKCKTNKSRNDEAEKSISDLQIYWNCHSWMFLHFQMLQGCSWSKESYALCHWCYHREQPSIASHTLLSQFSQLHFHHCRTNVENKYIHIYKATQVSSSCLKH